MRVVKTLLALALLTSACATVKPWQKGRLAGPALQFEVDPWAEGQQHSILEITERSTYSSAGPGSAGAGCGCH